MKKIIYLLVVLQGSFILAQSKRVVTQNGEKITITPYADNGLTNNNGFTQLGGVLTKPTTIKTTETNTLSLQDLPSNINPEDVPVVMIADGTLKKGAFPVVDIVPNQIGTVIVIDGKMEVAQEITVTMASDFSFAGGSTVLVADKIGNLTNIIIDNKKTYTSNATGNSFSVVKSGIYQIIMNILLTDSTTGDFPVIGVWNDTTDLWVARINDEYTAPTTAPAPMTGKKLQKYTLITAIPLEAGNPYSFRATGNGTTITVIATSADATGSGAASFVSVKRLK